MAIFSQSSRADYFKDKKRLGSCKYKLLSLMRICSSNTLFYSSSKTFSSNILFSISASKADHFNDRYISWCLWLRYALQRNGIMIPFSNSSSKAAHFDDRKSLNSCRYKLMSLMRICLSKIFYYYIIFNLSLKAGLLMPFFHHQSQLISIKERS